MRMFSFSKLRIFLLLVMLGHQSSAWAESAGLQTASTKLNIINSYSELLTIQDTLQSLSESELIESKGFPEGIKLFPDSHQRYLDEVAKLIFDKAESYISYYYNDDDCPGRHANSATPVVGADIFRYTTSFFNSSSEDVTLQISAFKSWYENGECYMASAITSATWRRQ